MKTALALLCGLLAACSAAPLTIDADHPASLVAAETPPAPPSLGVDADTQRTRDLLAQRERESNPTEGHEHP